MGGGSWPTWARASTTGAWTTTAARTRPWWGTRSRPSRATTRGPGSSSTASSPTTRTRSASRRCRCSSRTRPSEGLGLFGEADVLTASFTAFVVLSQTLHGWSHGSKAALPPWVLAMQDLGVFISRQAHAEHHTAPFEGNYCIVSGVWNPLLDGKLGKTSVFRKMEGAIFKRWGVVPRCWLTKEELNEAVAAGPCM